MVKTCLFKQRPNIQIQRVMDHKTWYLWIQASERVQHVWPPKTCLQWLARRTKPCTYQTGKQTKCFKLYNGVQTSSNTIKSDQTVNIWPRLNYYLASSLASAFHYSILDLFWVVWYERNSEPFSRHLFQIHHQNNHSQSTMGLWEEGHRGTGQFITSMMDATKVLSFLF